MLRTLIGKQEINPFFFFFSEGTHKFSKQNLSKTLACIQYYLTVKQIKKQILNMCFLYSTIAWTLRGSRNCTFVFLSFGSSLGRKALEETIPLHSQMAVLKEPQGLLSGEAQLHGGFCPLSISVSGMYSFDKQLLASD